MRSLERCTRHGYCLTTRYPGGISKNSGMAGTSATLLASRLNGISKTSLGMGSVL